MGERDPLQVRFDPNQLTEALQAIPISAWSDASAYPVTGVHHGYRRVVLVSAGKLQPHAERFDFVWQAMNPVRDAWLSCIDPGGFVVPHRDPAPWRERWQVPIVSSGELRTAHEVLSPAPGESFRVTHWEPHEVVNRGSTPRIHIVIDRDVLVHRPPLPFETFPIPDTMSDLVERSQQ